MTVKMSAIDLRRRLLKALALFLVLVTVFSVTVYATEEEGGTQEETSAVETTVATEEESSKLAEETTAEESTTDDTYKELQSQYDALENQMAANQDKLDKVQSDMNKQEQIVDGLGNKIDNTQNQVNLLITQQQILNSEINSTEKQIGVITAQLGSLSEQIVATKQLVGEKQRMRDETYELLKLRIRAMYMSGNGSTIEFLLTSENFSTLLIRTELVLRVAKHDNDLMETFASDIELLESLEATLINSVNEEEQKKTDLNKKTQSLAANKAESIKNSNLLAEKQKELEKEMQAAEKELASLDKESDEYKALISKQEDELIALSNQMEEFIKNNGSSTTDKVDPPSEEESSKAEEDEKDNPYADPDAPVSSSGMIFPLKCSGVYISSPYGMRTHPVTGEYKLHTGTDFCAAGINGKTVYAVKDGVVIYAAKHKAYGNFVIIDHGNGVSSCYAHMQDGSMKVAVGDKVQQGQPIGKVGSTGYSTGPHLHFEIRIDGKTTNPMNGYVKLPG